MDIKPKADRSANMARIRGRDTQPELVVRFLIFHSGYRYRIAPKKIPGHPDVYLGPRKCAIFVHGCFWHRHEGCPTATTPKTNTEFWLAKFERNMERDRRTVLELKSRGIRVLVIWECSVKKALKSEEDLNYLRDSIISFIENGRKDYLEI